MPRTKAYDEDVVLERAMELFWRKGYHATSIQDLVDHLGINRGSLYSEFGDKKQLFHRSVALYRKNNAENLRKFLRSHANVKAGLRALFVQAYDEQKKDVYQKGCFLVNTTTELANIDLEIKDQLKQSQNFFIDLIQNYIEEGKVKKEVRQEVNSAMIAHLLYTIFNGMRVLGKVDEDQHQILAGVDAILEPL